MEQRSTCRLSKKKGGEGRADTRKKKGRGKGAGGNLSRRKKKRALLIKEGRRLEAHSPAGQPWGGECRLVLEGKDENSYSTEKEALVVIRRYTTFGGVCMPTKGKPVPTKRKGSKSGTHKGDRSQYYPGEPWGKETPTVLHLLHPQEGRGGKTVTTSREK